MKFTESIKVLANEHIKNPLQILNMAKKDLKKQFSGTALGVLWPLIKNMIYVFAYWFTIQIGLKGTTKSIDQPYIIWLAVGLVPWFFIRDTIVPAASSIRSNRYLVTKTVFPTSIIPTFKVLSGFISSFMFIGIVILMCIGSGIYPDIYWLQTIYYAFAAFILLVAISLTTSALVVVSRDVEFLLKSIIVLIFWVSPILWPISNIKNQLLSIIVKLNPFFYIIEGFRNSILYHKWFWESPALTLYFWGIVLILLAVGIFIHGKLRDYFADIL
ncbi:ABC-type polysaccharide/polyol phosphate export permease [Clostridium moniliforme]|uniref:Transport permease protein n=1 Tax=Clostridium moniliforme TaxID=39489 RepID=A0ABS4F1M5_9CLOT|nr:ABC transporter permease [Clostridium moniliforme]MBP1890154.1 ABC-type polysaccharide/polyol phosphate export permease [Clostridium moniliforme]